MDTVLGHLARLTSHRDHHQLDVAVLEALEDLVATTEARIYDIYRSHDKPMLRLRLTLSGGRATVPQMHFTDPDKAGEALGQYPALQSCIENRLSVGHDVAPDGGCRLW